MQVWRAVEKAVDTVHNLNEKVGKGRFCDGFSDIKRWQNTNLLLQNVTAFWFVCNYNMIFYKNRTLTCGLVYGSI